VVMIYQRHRLIDGRTDGQTTRDSNIALCTVVHRTVKDAYGANVQNRQTL